jgi:hypothetical protein
MFKSAEPSRDYDSFFEPTIGKSDQNRMTKKNSVSRVQVSDLGPTEGGQLDRAGVA